MQDLTTGPPLDVVIIGAGQAGIPLAHALAKAGIARHAAVFGLRVPAVARTSYAA